MDHGDDSQHSHPACLTSDLNNQPLPLLHSKSAPVLLEPPLTSTEILARLHSLLEDEPPIVRKASYNSQEGGGGEG